MHFKKIFILCIITISVLLNIYLLYLVSKNMQCIHYLRKESKSLPYILALEQVDNIQLYYQKPEIFKTKLYAESEAFFKMINKSSESTQLKIVCSSWTNNSKNVFHNILKESKNLYRLDDDSYQEVLNGIDFMDTLCSQNNIIEINQEGKED